MPALHPGALLLLAALARLPVALGSSAWVPADGPQVDAVLFRTHFVDALIVKKLTELVQSSAAPLGSPPVPSSAVAVAADGRLDPATSRPPVGFEVTVLFDSEAAADFGHRLQQAGFNYSAHGVQLLGLTLRDFTHYPNVKPVGAGKLLGSSLNGNDATTHVRNFQSFPSHIQTHTHTHTIENSPRRCPWPRATTSTSRIRRGGPSTGAGGTGGTCGAWSTTWRSPAAAGGASSTRTLPHPMRRGTSSAGASDGPCAATRCGGRRCSGRRWGGCSRILQGVTRSGQRGSSVLQLPSFLSLSLLFPLITGARWWAVEHWATARQGWARRGARQGRGDALWPAAARLGPVPEPPRGRQPRGHHRTRGGEETGKTKVRAVPDEETTHQDTTLPTFPFLSMWRSSSLVSPSVLCLRVCVLSLRTRDGKGGAADAV